MKILLTGAAGQLGNELYPLLCKLGQVFATDVNPSASVAPDCVAADLSDPVRLERLLSDSDPGLIVNAAAYTAVDRAEEQPELCGRVNAQLPAALAEWAATHSRALFHYSTDYVFDGSAERPYRESDAPAPLNVYGETKLAGEQAIEQSGCDAVVIRTSWVYSSHGHNFLLSMLRLGRERPELRIVDDQLGCPTWARSLARATVACVDQGLPAPGGGCRLFHYSDRDAVTWHDFAAAIFEAATRAGLIEARPRLERIGTDEYPQAATRPRYSVLDTRAIRDELGFEPAALRGCLDECMKEIAKHG